MFSFLLGFSTPTSSQLVTFIIFSSALSRDGNFSHFCHSTAVVVMFSPLLD